jgi:endonuclease/exonuclease/phosphatase family metal-dependent hydrolase
MEEDGVRVATLNLWGQNGAWEERRSVLMDGLRGLQPDLIAFQEAIVGDGYDQVEDILGTGYYVVHQSVGLVGDGNNGASIASRWPTGEVREVNLHLTPRTGDYPCGTLAAEILAPDPLGPFCCHGPSHQLSYEYERELQAVAAAKLVEELAEGVGTRHVVVGGDFNADPSASSVAFCAARGPWGARACAIGTLGRGPDPGKQDTRSRRATRWCPRTSPLLGRSAGWITFSCAARTPCTAPRSRSLHASSSSMSPWTGFGAATTSASSLTFRPRRLVDARCGDRPSSRLYSPECVEGEFSEVRMQDAA